MSLKENYNLLQRKTVQQNAKQLNLQWLRRKKLKDRTVKQRGHKTAVCQNINRRKHVITHYWQQTESH